MTAVLYAAAAVVAFVFFFTVSELIRIIRIKPLPDSPDKADADKFSLNVNGKTAEKYYNKYIRDTIGRAAICLPSTSPANAGGSVQKLIEAWQIIKPEP